MTHGLTVVTPGLVRPGEVMTVAIEWADLAPGETIEVQLAWTTGNCHPVETSVADTRSVPAGGGSGRTALTFVSPAGPLSFIGAMATLGWRVRVAASGGATAVAPFALSLTDGPIRLRPAGERPR
ncbi:MAG: hypothetical protein R2745_13145 [Vicinamibacterales bacterium]